MGNVTCQSNTGGGVRINNSRRNIMTLYTENNTGDEVELTSHANCHGNILTLLGAATTGVVDNTGNQDTFVDANVTTGTDRITVTGHPFSNSDLALLTTTGTLPAGLATSTRYYIKSIDADTIELYSDQTLASIVDITAAAGGGTHTIKSADLDANSLFTTKHQAEFDPKFRGVSADSFSLTSQHFDGSSASGRLDITHPSTRRYDINASGASTSAGHEIRLTNTDALGDLHLYVSGRIGCGVTVANTNTPSGATSRAFPIYDETGSLLGYIPVYGSQW